MTKEEKLYLNCLRTTFEVWQHGTLDRWGAVACMATCIDIRMRAPGEEIGWRPGETRTPPTLDLGEELSADDRAFLELYEEAGTFWVTGMGMLRLIK